MGRAAGGDKCAWCGRTVSSRASFGSQRYGLTRRGVAACDTCLDAGAHEDPPPGWSESDGAWSHDTVDDLHERERTPVLFVIGGLWLAAGPVWLAFALHSEGFVVAVGYVILLAIGSVGALLTPVQVPDRAPANTTQLVLAMGLAALGKTAFRMTEGHEALRQVLVWAFVVLTGWAPVYLIRTGLAVRRSRSGEHVPTVPPGDPAARPHHDDARDGDEHGDPP